MPDSNLLLIILSALIALGLAAFQYLYKSRRSTPYVWVLTIFRTVGLFSVFLLLINPELVTTSFYPEKPNLLLAVDNSASIEASGKGEEVRELVAELTGDPEIQKHFNVQTFSFGKDLRKAEEFDFSESFTNIQSALSSLRSLFKNTTAPTVLITDGNQTFGSDYRFGLQNYGNSILPVVVGDTATYQDLSLYRVNVNKYAFLNNQFPVEMILNYSGNSPVQTRLRILKGNTTVFSQTLSLSRSKNSEIVKALLPASTIGVSVYRAELMPLEAEKNIQNNQQNFAVEVIDERTSVLIVGSMLHPDMGALKRAIETNKQREVDIRNINDLPARLEDFELVVLFQPTAEFASLTEELEVQNKNYLIIAGAETDWRFLNQAQPYFRKDITGQTEEYFPILNTDFSSFQLDDIGYSQFPPLKGSFGEIEISQEAQILLFQKVQGVTTQEPLLISLEQGGAKKAFLFGTGLWKWRMQVFSEESSFESFDSFIGKLVQYLTSNSKKERLTLNYENIYFSNRNIILTANYFDENYNFDPRGKLSLTLLNNDTRESQEIPLGIVGNKYQVELSQLNPADYTFTISVEGENLSRSGSFTVIEFNVEDQFSSANLPGLQKVAQDQNGKIYFPDKPAAIKEALLSDIKNSTVQKSRRNHVSLIDWYYLLAVIAVSFSAEWFLRKYHGLI